MDASVYGWNSRSARCWPHGDILLTMPWELNSREIEPVLGPAAAWGWPASLLSMETPMMVSAQCITNTVKGCTHKRGTLMMKDRTGALLPVKNHCSFCCYNTIYNPAPCPAGRRKAGGPAHAGSPPLSVYGGNRADRRGTGFIHQFLCIWQGCGSPFRDFTRTL